MDIKEVSMVIMFPFPGKFTLIEVQRTQKKGRTWGKRIWWKGMRLKARKQLEYYTNLGNNSDK